MEEGAPPCECGCGSKVLWCLHKKRYKRFLFNHHLPSARSVVLSERQKQIILGTSLGDGSISFIKNRITKSESGMARLRIRHSTNRQLDYTNWIRAELNNICSAAVKLSENAGFGKEIAGFSTLSHPWIYEVGKSLYSPTKMVTDDYLDRLTDLGFAVWWMDDGSTTSLATHSFSENEQHIILRWLNRKFDVTGFMDRDKRVDLPFIRFRQPDVERVLKMVFPNVIPSLHYKMGRFLSKMLHRKVRK